MHRATLRHRSLVTALLATLMLATGLCFGQDESAPTTIAKGVVYADANANGQRDPGEAGIADVRVSNQVDVVRTDAGGSYELPVTDDTIIFVVKPRGYAMPADADGRWEGYYINKPAGSPEQRYAGVAPTGDLPDSVDFGLVPHEEGDTFQAIFFGDPQPRNSREVGYIGTRVVPELVGSDAAFGIALGDDAFDNPAIHDQVASAFGKIGFPMYYVLGNHDENYDSPDDAHSTESFQRAFGPPYYSFDFGAVHFIVLDDVNWLGPRSEEAAKRKALYVAGLGEKQMGWLAKDLAMVPKDQLVVLSMHIPLEETAELPAIFALLEGRPTLSFSAHTHTYEQRFYGEDKGWHGAEPHHHIVAGATCGAWWGGVPAADGAPVSPCCDGTPIGYTVMTFDGSTYDARFKACEEDPSVQMRLTVTDGAGVAEGPPQAEGDAAAEPAPGRFVYANVFVACPTDPVEFRFGDTGEWQPMERIVAADPYFEAERAKAHNIEKPFTPLGGPSACQHLWRVAVPEGLAEGARTLHVRTTDMYGHEYEGATEVPAE
jgi:hypothetical protein